MPVVPLVVRTGIVHVYVRFGRTDALGTQGQVVILPRHELELGRVAEDAVPFLLLRQAGTAEESALDDQRKSFADGISQCSADIAIKERLAKYC